MLALCFIPQDNSKHTPKPLTIDSKWTAKREKRTEPNNIFSTENIFNPKVPEKKSFNKKIVVIERKTKKQQEAENKAIHDYSTIPKEDCNVKANRTTWDTHKQYGSISILSNKISHIIYDFIKFLFDSFLYFSKFCKYKKKN